MGPSSMKAPRLPGGAQEEARDVARVDRLDQEADAGLAQARRRVAQVADERRVQEAPVGPLRRSAGEAVHLPAAEGGRVPDGAVDALAELLLAARQARDAALALRPVAGRKVVEHLLEPEAAEADTSASTANS